MKTADEMFEDLGYEKSSLDGMAVYSKTIIGKQYNKKKVIVVYETGSVNYIKAMFLETKSSGWVFLRFQSLAEEEENAAECKANEFRFGREEKQ